MRKAGRVSTLTSFKVVDVLEAVERLQRQGGDIVRLEAGQSAFATPARMVEATHRARQCVRFSYTEPLPRLELAVERLRLELARR